MLLVWFITVTPGFVFLSTIEGIILLDKKHNYSRVPILFCVGFMPILNILSSKHDYCDGVN